MVRRVCRVLGDAKSLVILYDEAHHCDAPAQRDAAQEGELDVQDRTQTKKDLEEAGVWLSGVQTVRDKLGLRAVYDLSATPFFLRGSGYAEGTLFPWVVSDFGLMDAIESGIVKSARVPVSDDAMTGEGPMYRDPWLRIRDVLPRKGIKDTPVERPLYHPEGVRGRPAPGGSRVTQSGQYTRSSAPARARDGNRGSRRRASLNRRTTSASAGVRAGMNGVAIPASSVPDATMWRAPLMGRRATLQPFNLPRFSRTCPVKLHRLLACSERLGHAVSELVLEPVRERVREHRGFYQGCCWCEPEPGAVRSLRRHVVRAS